MASTNKQRHDSTATDWLSIRDAAARFEVSHHTIRRWIREGKIEAAQASGPHGVQYFIPVSQQDPREVPSDVDPDRIDYPQQSDTHLIARDRELDALSQALRESASGTSKFVILSGASGIGKTSLVRELCGLADRLGFRSLIGHCYELDNTPPYGPWIELLRSYSKSDASPPAPAIDSEELERLGSTADLHRTIEHFIVTLSDLQPSLVVLEDCHWADQSSLDLVRYLGRALHGRRVMILITYRDDELLVDQPLHHILPALVRETGAVRLRPAPFTHDDVLRVVEARYAINDDDRVELAEYLTQYSEGVPFYVDELTAHLENAGVLVEEGGRWKLSASPRVEVPPLVRQMAINRFTSLPESAREHLQVAAVIGVDAPIDLLQRVTGTSPNMLADSIEVALRARLIDEDPEHQSVRFRHALIREALYSSLLVLRRRDIHRQVAEALASQPGSDPDVIAHHFSQAQDRRAAEWLLSAGRRAALTFAYQETIDRFEQALAILEGDPEEDVTRASVYCELAIAYRYIDPHQALLLVGRGLDIARRINDEALVSVLLRTRSHIRGFIGENGLPELRQSVEMFEQLPKDQQERIRQSSLGHAVSGGAYAQRVAYYAQYNDARELADEFLRNAPYPRIKRDHYEFGLAHLALGLAYANLGDPEAALAALGRARNSFDEASNKYLYGMALTHEYNYVVQVYYPERSDERRRLIAAVDEAFNRSVMAYLAQERSSARLYYGLITDGRWDEARESALSLVDNAYMRVECSTTLALVDFMQGRYDYAWEWVRRALPDGTLTEPGTVYHHDILEVQQVATHLALRAGDLDLARRWIEAHERWHTASDSIIGKHTPDMLWAMYYRSTGDVERASEHAHRALQEVQQPRQPLAILEASRLLGELAQVAGKVDEATRYLSLALELSHSFDMPYEIALSQIATAETLGAGGDWSSAEKMLREARELLQGLKAQPALEHLEEVERRIIKSEAEPSNIAGLSPRELEVLKLVATGLTDAEIADQLFISPRTVGGHLQSIYQKTGVSSRTAATAYAYTHGLAGTSN